MKATYAVRHLITISGKSLNYLVKKGFVKFNEHSGRYVITKKGKKLREKIVKGKISKLSRRKGILFPFLGG